MSKGRNRNGETTETTPLTEAEKVFVEEYIYDYNGVQAYLKAYPDVSYASAAVQACKLLKKVNIVKEVEAAKMERAKEARISVKRVLQEIAALAFSDQGNYFFADNEDGGMPCPKPFNKVKPAHRKAISEIKVTRRRLKSGKDKTQWEVEKVSYKLHDKVKALDKLCQRLGITKDGASYEELVALLASCAKENPGSNVAQAGAAGPPTSTTPPAKPRK